MSSGIAKFGYRPWFLMSQIAYGRWHILYEEYQARQQRAADCRPS